MKIVRYIRRDSIIHQLDPRTLLLFLGMIITSTFLLNHPISLTLIFLIVLLTAYKAKVLKEFFMRIKRLFPMIAFAFFIWFLFPYLSLFHSVPKGGTSLSLFFMSVNSKRVMYALSMSIRILILVTTPILFFMVLPNSDLVRALEELKFPYHIAFGIGLSLRMVDVFEDEFRTTREAQKSRGVEMDKGGLIKRIKNQIPVILPVILQGIKKSDYLAMAMDLRGFNSIESRTNYRELDFKSLDYKFIGLSLTLLILTILLRIRGVGVL